MVTVKMTFLKKIHTHRCFLLIAMCLILFSLSFLVRYHNGEQSKFLNYRYSYFGIPVAVSYLQGHPRNYAGFKSAFDNLPRHPPPEQYNGLIEKALEISPQEMDYPIMFLADIGMADTAYYAFSLFGPKKESIFYFINLLIFGSLSAFLIRFRRDAPALVVGIIGTLVLLMDSKYGFLISTGKSGITDPSSFAVLMLFPISHLVLTASQRQPIEDQPNLTIRTGVLFYQLAFLFFINLTRQTVVVQSAPLFLGGVLFVIISIYKDFRVRFMFSRLSVIILLGITIMGVGLYKDFVKSPIAYSKGQSHPFWHNMRWGLAFNREIAKEAGWPYQFICTEEDRKTDPCRNLCASLGASCQAPDNIAVYNVKLHLERQRKFHEASWMIPNPSGYKWNFYENTGKEIFFETLLKMPAASARLFFWDKPKRVAEIVQSDIGSVIFKVVFHPFVLITLITTVLLAWRDWKRWNLLQATFIFFSFFSMSAAVPIVFFPQNYIMGSVEFSFISLITYALFLTLLALPFILTAGWRRLNPASGGAPVMATTSHSIEES